MTIVVTGGSGFIGTELTKELLEKGHTVIVVDKKGPSLTHEKLFFIPCNLEETALPFNVLERADAVIHLAGRTILGKWTQVVKEEIKNSRVRTTRHVVESIEKTTAKPPIFICASALAYYGEGFDRELDENSAAGQTFLAGVVKEWEEEAMKAERLGVRVVTVRTAPVIGKGGFMRLLLKMARFHITFKFSKKDFWMPWIHIKDVVRIYLFALETNTLQGPVNATTPFPLKHEAFMKQFAKQTRSIVFSSVPFAKALFGDFLSEMTNSQKVFPRRLLDKGFAFAYTVLSEAIADAKE